MFIIFSENKEIAHVFNIILYSCNIDHFKFGALFYILDQVFFGNLLFSFFSTILSRNKSSLGSLQVLRLTYLRDGQGRLLLNPIPRSFSIAATIENRLSSGSLSIVAFYASR